MLVTVTGIDLVKCGAKMRVLSWEVQAIRWCGVDAKGEKWTELRTHCEYGGS